ncbi:MAG: type IV pilus modification PilV family protein [Thermodesulfobacteriota bacterium]
MLGPHFTVFSTWNKKSRIQRGKQGFTLLEVLIALIIVALAVTVYFQLISAGMKLEYKAEKKVAYAVQAEQLFQRLQTQDVRDDDFKWQGKNGHCPWELQIRPVDVQGPQWEEDQIQITKVTELYSFILTYACPDAAPLTLRRMSVVGPDFFTDQFKDEHIEVQ